MNGDRYLDHARDLSGIAKKRQGYSPSNIFSL